MLSKENQQILAQIDGKDGGAQMVKPGVEGYDLGVPEERFIKQDYLPLVKIGSQY